MLSSEDVELSALTDLLESVADYFRDEELCVDDLRELFAWLQELESTNFNAALSKALHAGEITQEDIDEAEEDEESRGADEVAMIREASAEATNKAFRLLVDFLYINIVIILKERRERPDRLSIDELVKAARVELNQTCSEEGGL